MMRWILIVLGGFAGLTVLAVMVLFFLSKRPGAGSLDAAVEIDRPASDVWTWIAEPEKQKQWVAWLNTIETKPGTQGLGREDTWLMVDPSSNQSYRIEGKITLWEPPRLLVQQVHLEKFFNGEYTYTLTETGGRTRLETSVTCNYFHPIWSIFEPLVTPEAKKKLVSDLARMKQLAEAAPPSPAQIVAAPGDTVASAPATP